MQQRIRFWAPVVLVLLSGVTAAARSSDSGGETEQRKPEEGEAEQDEAALMYTRGMELVAKGEYEEARERFEQANKKRKNDPEFLNMLAYTQRKTGEMEKAFENYEKALKIQPEFPQAREYLGEAHLQAVLLQLEALRGYGDKGKQDYDELVAALKRAAETLSAEAFADPGAKTAGW